MPHGGGQPGLQHIHAAVDVQRLAGDVFGARQIDDRVGDIFYPSQFGERDLVGDGLFLLIVQFVGHVGLDEARRNAVDGDAT